MSELMKRESIDAVEAGRNAALAQMDAAYLSFHDALDRVRKHSVGGAVTIDAKFQEAFFSSKSHQRRLSDDEKGKLLPSWETGVDVPHGYVRIPAAEHFREIVRQKVDRSIWLYLVEHTGIDSLMDRQAREEFHSELYNNPPALTAETAHATLSHLLVNRRDMYLRGIANAFGALDRRFRSHDGFKIGARIVLERALSEWGGWENYNREGTLRDIETVFHELDGRGPVDAYASISNEIKNIRASARPCVVQGDYFRARLFKNGNVHLWFENDALVRQINRLLAEYYGEVIGEGTDATDKETGPDMRRAPAKNFAFFPTSEETAHAALRYADGALTIWEPDTKATRPARVLEPSAGQGGLAIPAREGGGDVTCVEIQPGMAHELRTVHGFADVHCRDFIDCTPAELGTFDLVLMNPPFDQGRAADHVRHAAQFVRPGGKLVAIVPAGLEYRADKRTAAMMRALKGWKSPYGRAENWWHDLPERSFAHAGTNINTAVLTVQRPYK